MHSFQEGTSTGESGNMTELTAQHLFEEIKRSVAAHDFSRAEALREELLNLDTMALKESIESAELIEAAKLAGIDQEHQLLWKELYDRLSPEEKNIFFYSLTSATFPAKTILTRQGQISDRLFLIEQGSLACVFHKDNHLFLQLGRGAVAGEDTFFNMALCTSFLVARSEVSFKVLEKAATLAWEEKAPGLYAKLESFCLEYGKYAEAYERTRQDESHPQRFSVDGQVSAALLTSSGKPTGKYFKATVADISSDGTCFFIKSSRKEGARLLLGRLLQMNFALKEKIKPLEFTARGRVVKVKFQLENDYSVHVQFTDTLPREKLKSLQDD